MLIMAALPPGIRRVFRLPWRRGARIRADVDEEIAFHLDMRAEELVSRGMAPSDARERAAGVGHLAVSLAHFAAR